MYLPLFFEPSLDAERLERLRTTLDTSGFWARRNLVRHLGSRELAALYEAAADTGSMTLDFVVPTPDPLVEVVHHGKNSLPGFSHFEKRFCRPDGDDAGTDLWGYNHNWAPQMAVTGPGYFTAKLSDKGELAIDYGTLPPRKPASWPAILPPDARLGRFIWSGLSDVLRKVSEQVSIGRAFSRGKAMDQWFALCREDPKA